MIFSPKAVISLFGDTYGMEITYIAGLKCAVHNIKAHWQIYLLDGITVISLEIKDIKASSWATVAKGLTLLK